MRIALVHPRAGDAGGVEGQIHGLAQGLLAAGHEVHYFCQRASVGVDPRLHVHRVADPVRPLRWLRVWLFDRLSRRALRRHGPFDIVHGFGKTSLHDVYRDGSGCFEDYRAAMGIRGWSLRALVVRRIERLRYTPGRFGRIVAISERVRRQILERYRLAPERVEVLHPAVDLERFHPGRADLARAALRRELGIPEAAPLLLFVGSDYQRKGLDSLVRALPQLPAAHVAVLGRDTGRRTQALRALAAEQGLEARLHLLGFRPDVESYLAAADCLVFPTRFDAFGNAVLEAMAAGIPVVVSAHAGAAELVCDGEGGAVVDAPEIPARLAAAIGPFLDPGLRAAAGRAARRRAERCSWKLQLERVLSIYEAVRAERDQVEAEQRR